MAPSVSTLEGKLRTAVEEVYASENQENLTVRFIRDKVENELDLNAGFFVTPDWKDKSKAIIKEWANKLIDEGESAALPVASIEVAPQPVKKAAPIKKAETPVKKGTKRGSAGEKARPNKRQKKEATPSEVSEEESSEASFDEESPASDFEADSDVSEAPKPKRQSKSKSRTPVKRNSKKKTVEPDESEDDDISDPPLSDEDEESEAASTPPKKAPKKTKNGTGSRRQSKKSVVESDEESEDETPKKSTPVKNSTPKKAAPHDDAATKANDSDSSEMSVVIDEPPKTKQKRRTKSEMASGISNPVKGPKAQKATKSKKEPPPIKDLTPAEAEIKTLQSHLVKCGVRKIWAFELKQYGEDNTAKIRHLQGMLKDIGMVGRFSESRAREIKELRELQADLEAVKEGDSKWGLESGRRNRVQRKSFKEESDEESDDEEAGEKTTRSRSASEAPKSRGAKAKQELAFLGDEDSSDSD